MDGWEAALENETFSATLLENVRDSVAAWRRGDIEWLLEHADRELEIVQPPELPDGRTYLGHEGLVAAILDWPREWENFELEPKRIFAVDDEQVVTLAVHRGRARQIDMQIEAEIVWLQRWHAGVLTRWEMFMDMAEALAAAELPAPPAGGAGRPAPSP